MTEEDQKYEEVANAIISYLDFIKEFKTKKEDYVITNEQNNTKLKYVFRNYNLDCFIIDKKYLDEFRKATNFDKLTQILKDNTEENKNKFKKELAEYLNENPYRFDEEEIKLYSTEDELKGIVNNFNSYSFVNKEICEIMGVPEDMLNSNVVKISKNSVNTALFFSKNNFIISINMDKNKKENITNENDEKNKTKEIEAKDGKIENYKNLYYVEEITKKVFALLYFNEQNIQNKLEKKIKDIFNFKKYYLINNKWLEDYKKYFLYDKITKIISDEFTNKNFTYKKIKYFLNDIIKSKIGQISLSQETQISNYIRDAKNLKCKIFKNKVKIKNDINNEQETLEAEEEEYFGYPINFNLIDEDLFNLLMKEEFFINVDDNLKEELSFNVLIGNNQIIINNKKTEDNEEKFKYSYEYLFYIRKEEDNENKYDLQYIINCNKKEDFFNTLEKIINEGLGKYVSNLEVDLEQKEIEVKVLDDKKNFIGKFVNIGLNEKNIKNYLDKNLFENNEEKDNIINENKIYDSNDDTNKNKNKRKDILKIVQMNGIEFKKEEKKGENKFEIKNIENFQFLAKIKEIKIEKKQINVNGNNKFINVSNNSKKDDEKKNIEKNRERNEKKIERKNEINLPEKENNFNINELRKKIDNLEQHFTNLFNIDNKKRNSGLKYLNQDEIIKKVNEHELVEVILIDQEFSEEFKQFNLMNDYAYSQKEEKNNLLSEYNEEFSEIYKMFNSEEKNTKNISLIKNIDDLKKIQEDMLLILNKNEFQNIYKEAKDVYIYYFIFRFKPYLFFKKENEYIEINKIENNIFTISDNLKQKEILKDLKAIKDQIDKNNELLKLNSDKNITEYYFKECYLINNTWLNSEISKYNNKPIPENNNLSPKIKEEEKELFKYPVDFGFVEKENYESIIKDLVSKDKNINIKDFCSAQIFFVNYQNNIPKEYENQKFMGVKIDNKIFFYIQSRYIFIFEFLIDYENEGIINDHIKKYLIKKGIGSYINDMGANISTKYFNLIDYEFNEIGSCFNFNKSKRKLFKREKTKILKDNQDSFFFNNALQCLVNIKEIHNFFSNKGNLIALIDDDSIFSKYFCNIVLDMWDTYNNENNDNIYTNLKKDLIKTTESNNILNNISLLIEFLLLRIHNEIRTNKDGGKIKDNFTKLDEMYQNFKEINNLFYPNNYSFIQKLFFFEVQTSYDCLSCKYSENQFFIKCIFDLELDQKPNKWKNTEIISIYSLLDLPQNITCIKCDYNCLYKRKINTCPNILIFVIKSKELKNIIFRFNEEIDIKDYLAANKKYYQTKYKLISSIINKSFYCKSMENNGWYKYEGNDIKSINSINNNFHNLPYVLIYKLKSNKFLYLK